MGCVYQAKNLINGKIYIGKTINSLDIRINAHKSDAGRGSVYYFHNAIQKYGLESFSWTLLYESDENKKLLEMEKIFIKLLNTINPNGYNLTAGGDGILGLKHTEESRKKMSIANKGKILSDETKRRMKKSMTEERKKKLSEISKNMSEETKQKMRMAKLGNKASEETRKKMSNVHKKRGTGKWMVGRKQPEEMIKKRIESRKGYKHSEETKRKIGLANKNLHLSKLAALELIVAQGNINATVH